MMRREEIKIFRERGDAFLDTARYNFERGRFDLAAFNVEPMWSRRFSFL